MDVQGHPSSRDNIGSINIIWLWLPPQTLTGPPEHSGLGIGWSDWLIVWLRSLRAFHRRAPAIFTPAWLLTSCGSNDSIYQYLSDQHRQSSNPHFWSLQRSLKCIWNNVFLVAAHTLLTPFQSVFCTAAWQRGLFRARLYSCQPPVVHTSSCEPGTNMRLAEPGL